MLFCLASFHDRAGYDMHHAAYALLAAYVSLIRQCLLHSIFHGHLLSQHADGKHHLVMHMFGMPCASQCKPKE